ncbi:MAG TPA: hypothetical protein VF521_04375, partial [Pyrinomonadaceae bacterium]
MLALPGCGGDSNDDPSGREVTTPAQKDSDPEPDATQAPAGGPGERSKSTRKKKSRSKARNSGAGSEGTGGARARAGNSSGARRFHGIDRSNYEISRTVCGT